MVHEDGRGSDQTGEMSWRLRLIALAVALAVAFTTTPAALAQDGSESTDEIVVVTTELGPFVISDGDIADGFYMEIWEDVAGAAGIEFSVEWAASFTEMLDRLRDGTADVAVAPLAPTAERELVYDFSSAVVASGPQLGVHERTGGRTSLLGTLVGSGALRVLMWAALGLIVLGHMIWLVERHDDEGFGDFHSSWPRGAWDGIWWAAVTVTTVGYGDTAPRSTRGRLIAMVAMLASLFLVGAFVSQVTADLEAGRSDSQISGLDDLGSRSVAAVEGSTFAAFVADQGVSVVGYPTQGAAFDAVERGDLDVLLANPFAIASLGPDAGVDAAGDVLYAEFETFGLQQDSPLREPINAALADLQSSGRIQRIIDRWIN